MRLTLRPSVQFRPYEAPVNDVATRSATRVTAAGHRYELSAGTGLPVLRLLLHGERARADAR